MANLITNTKSVRVKEEILSLPPVSCARKWWVTRKLITPRALFIIELYFRATYRSSVRKMPMECIQMEVLVGTAIVRIIWLRTAGRRSGITEDLAIEGTITRRGKETLNPTNLARTFNIRNGKWSNVEDEYENNSTRASQLKQRDESLLARFISRYRLNNIRPPPKQ